MALTVTALVVAICAAEGALRLGYSDLPSQAALSAEGSGFRYFNWSAGPRMPTPRINTYDCQAPLALVKADFHRTRYGAASERRPLELWVAGDSITWGHGVERGQVYGAHLGRRLAQETSRQVRVTNLAVPGAGYCLALNLIHNALARGERPDLVVLQLFADDLELRFVVSDGRRVVAFPDQLEPAPLRRVVSSS